MVLEIEESHQLDFSVLSGELKNLKTECKRINYLVVAKAAFGFRSLFPWPFLLLSFACILSLFVQGFLFDIKSNYWVGAIYLAIFILSLGVTFHNELAKLREFSLKLHSLSEHITDCGNLPKLETLLEQSVSSESDEPNTTVEVLLRGNSFDQNFVNLPASLLSTGDIINLHIGQSSPCKAVYSLDPCLTLEKGETLSADALANYSDDPNAVCGHRFKVLKSPIVESLEKYLNINGEYPSNKKSILSRRRERAMAIFLFAVYPVLFICSSVAAVTWYILNSQHTLFLYQQKQPKVVDQIFVEWRSESYWLQILFCAPALFFHPLLPIAFPVIWILLFAIGEAKTLAPCLGTSIAWKKGKAVKPELLWIQLLPEVLCGGNRIFAKNSGVFDSLGSLTVLCCINKEGILSWVSPYPEKVVFLGLRQSGSILKPFSSLESDDMEVKDSSGKTEALENQSKEKQYPTGQMEVLTFSQDTQDPNKINFDDPDWQEHISSLKAICLNILVTHPSLMINEMNLPSSLKDLEEILVNDIAQVLQEFRGKDNKQMKTPQECQNLLKDHKKQLRVVARSEGMSPHGQLSMCSGLHSLAALTGFKDEVSFLYMPKRVVTLYSTSKSQHTPDQAARLMNHPPDAFMSYIHGVVVNKLLEDQNHLLVSGSGDAVVNQCKYYWDGSEVKLLEDHQRTKAIDFYNRSVAVGLCIAFSFVPVSEEFAKEPSFIKEFTGEMSEADLPSGQIFLGVVSLQYQSRLPVFHLVEALETACIRFVHFTSEDEIRARVFAEKMGIEVGWNCHISLASCGSNPSQGGASETWNTSESVEDIEREQETFLMRRQQSPLSYSESSISESVFHALNRAKLPRGIENIEPHINNVDNVPLLVPLFTDCRHESTRRMIEIMQKYGEVVGCIGSSDSADNFPIFAQANASVALQPVAKAASQASRDSARVFDDRSENLIERNASFYTKPSVGSGEASVALNLEFPSSRGDVMNCSRLLNTFPCSVALSGGGSLSLVFDMIKEARHFLFLIQVSFIFYLKSLCCVSLAVFLCHVTHFPAVFAASDTLWLCYVVLPLLSFSVLASPADPDLMSWASLKNTSRQLINRQIVRQNVANFFLKFFPSCLVVVVVFALGVTSSCVQLQREHSLYGNSSNSNSSTQFWRSFEKVECYPYFMVFRRTLSTIEVSELQAWMGVNRRETQQIALCSFVLYMCLISVGYVHRWRLANQRSPFLNRVWMLVVLFIFVIQVIYSSAVVFVRRPLQFKNIALETSSGPYQVVVWVLMVVWCLPCFALNELIKWREIRMWNRSQKRARLEFGTKLGMNSPF